MKMCSNCYAKSLWLCAAVLMTGLVCSTEAISAQAVPSIQVIPGSAVDKRLLGKWETPYPNGQDKITEISTASESFAQLRKAWSLPSTWQPQTNDAVMLDAKGNISSANQVGLVRCLNLKGGGILLVGFARSGGKFIFGLPTQYLPNEESTSLVMGDFISNKPVLRATKILPEAEMKKPEHTPGGLVDPALIGKWMWEKAGGQPSEYVEISANEEAYKKYTAQNAPSLGASWQAPPNVAIFSNPTHKYTTVLQSFDLEDGTKLICLWGTELSYCRYVKKGNGIELTTIGLLGNEVTRLRPLTPEEVQAANDLDKNQELATKDKAVMANLKKIATAAAQYLLDKSAAEVRGSQLIGATPDSYIVSLDSVYGEKYDDIDVHQTDSSISVKLPDGRVITYDF